MKTTGKTRSKAAAWVLGLAGGAALGAFVLSPMGSNIADAKPIVVQPPNGAPMSFADLIENVSPAVVSVQVTTEVEAADQYADLFERFRNLPGFDDYLERRGEEGEDEGSPREGRSLGSGFFISEEGHIVTNNHVVENASEVTITLSNGDELEAEIIGLDALTDLAVLKVKKKDKYPYVKFSTERAPRVGDWVVAVGNPFGLGGTATAGIVSASGREMLGSNYSNFIQVDAPINRGNSGGPTFDLYGEVIGVNTAIFSPSGGSVGIGFAIEANVAQEITQVLIEEGKVTRGWLGVSIQSLSEEMAEARGLLDAEGEIDTNGALVADVTPGSPAEDGNIQRGDIIVEVNGMKVEDSRELTRVVGSLLAGSKNSFKVLRDGKFQTVNVTVGVRPDDLGSTLSPQEEPESSDGTPEGTTELFGMSVMPATDDIREALGLKTSEKGLFVADISRSSAFVDAGVEDGDVLLEAQGVALGKAQDLTKVVEEARKEGKQNILVAVRKGRATLFRTVEIESLK